MSRPSYNKYSCHDTWGHRLLRGLYSSLVPGAGQLVGGARKRGYVMVGVVAAVIVALVLLVLTAVEDVNQLLLWLISPTNLLILLIIDIVILVFRVYAVADALWLRRTRWGSTEKQRAFGKRMAGAGDRGAARVGAGAGKLNLPLAMAGLVLLFAFTVFPHVWIGYKYVYKFRSVLSTVFVHAPATTTTSLVTTTTLQGSVTVSTEPAISTTTVAPVTVDAGEDGKLTILFEGSDAGVGRTGGRADTNIVASFDLNTGRIALFSIPRNTGNAPLSAAAQKAMGMKYYSNWITGLYGSAQRHPELAPEGGDAGAVTMRDTIGEMLGIKIDYYAVVDMLGFVNLVDIMGGVDVSLEKPLHMSISPPTEEEETLVYDLKAGKNHLDGRMALAYARTRHDSDDFVRMGRQRCVIAALIDQTTMTELIWNFPAIMDVIKSMMRTDIPIEALQELVKLRTKLNTKEMITVGLNYPKYARSLNDNQKQRGWIPNTKLMQETVKRVLEHPEEVLAESKKSGLDNSSCWKQPQTQ